jgi:F-type H+-transporting ATPase subunit a
MEQVASETEGAETHAEGGFAIDPMHQFEIHPIGGKIEIGGFDVSFTNSALWMVVAVVATTLLLTYAMRARSLVPGRLQSVAEVFYEMIANMVRSNVGKAGRPYFPFIFTLFMFTLLGNVQSLIPGSFAFTAHIVVTFALAIVIFIFVTILGFAIHGLHFLRMFFPHGAPTWTAVILIPIELISYLSRPISHSVRLFANMTVGHVLFKVLAGFTVIMGVAGVAPFVLLIGITALELLVAILQAYVFTILACVYLNDAIHMH